MRYGTVYKGGKITNTKNHIYKTQSDNEIKAFIQITTEINSFITQTTQTCGITVAGVFMVNRSLIFTVSCLFMAQSYTYFNP